MQRLIYIKRCLAEDFDKWRKEHPFEVEPSPQNVIEFLVQKGFLKGKKWLDYIDSLPFEHFLDRVKLAEPLREGFILPNALFGRVKKEGFQKWSKI